MGILRSWAARHRVALALPAAALLTAVAQPVAADSGDPQSQVNDAQQNLKNAQSHASAEDRVLASAQATLAADTARLHALQHQIMVLDSAIAGDTITLNELRTQLAADRAHLAAYVKNAYENGGSEAVLVYIISAKDIPTAIQRKEQADHVASAAQQLVQQINGESLKAQQTLDSDNAARAQLAVAQQQAQTQQAVVAVQVQQVQAADVAAHQAVGQAQGALDAAKAALAAAQAAGTIYSAIPGSTFTVDTDLTQPSGETAAGLDQFLQGTPMAGLGGSFIHAEQAFHVSARYFVAHGILESDWGNSAIARDKHNLFGFGADDAHPYTDAKTFPSFDACIQYVAQFIQVHYLTPGGSFYHGPTLRGMNVDYASDPGWAAKIARIAQTIP